MERYIKLSEYAKSIGVSYMTAYRYFRRGMLDSKQLETGTVLIKVEDELKSNSKAAVYARVSSNENKDNLLKQQERIEQYAVAKGYEVAYSVAETGSGLNDNRKKLLDLFKKDFNILIVEHKDRLTRFGFNYIETLLNLQGKKIIVINSTDNKSDNLMEDLISIIYSFSARIYGLRRSKRKTEKIIAELKKED